MARHITHLRITRQFSLLLLLALVLDFCGLGSAQDGQKGSPPQEPPKGQGSGPKSGGQGGGGVSTGVGIDVGEVIGLFHHHAKVQLQANPQQVPAGQPVLFTATVSPEASGLTYEFHWTKDKDSLGQSESNPSVNHAYSAAGQYTANVVVYAKGKKIATSNDVSITVQQPAPVVKDVRLSLQQNQAKSLNIAASNNCGQTERWEVVSQPFPAFMHLTGDWSFDVNAHSKRDFPLEYNSSGLKEGEHEGTVIVRCVTCIPGKCNSVPNILKVHLTIEPVLVASVPGAGANGVPTPAPPDKTTEPVKTASPPPAVVLPVVTPTSAVATPSAATPKTAGSNGTLSTGKGDQPQQQNARETSTNTGPPVQSGPAGAATQPVQGDPGQTVVAGTVSKPSGQGRKKLESEIQIDAVLPLWLKALLVLILILAILAATLSMRKARKMVKAAVSINIDPGHHKISPDVVESGEGLQILCVRGAAVSKIIFTPSDPLPQENKETAHV